MQTPQDPHSGQPVLRRGPAPAQARLAVVLLHGRGDSASGILGLADELGAPDVLWTAPQAAGHAWYPYSFLSPLAQNEPGLSSGLRVIDRLVGTLAAEGVPPERVVLMGFSQGACLAQEFAARHARRYHAIVGLSGGLIGPPGTPRDYTGAFDGTPVFLGCSDIDPHIPVERVHESAEVFRRMGASVDVRIYPRMGHTVNYDEAEAVRALLATEDNTAENTADNTAENTADNTAENTAENTADNTEDNTAGNTADNTEETQAKHRNTRRHGR